MIPRQFSRALRMTAVVLTVGSTGWVTTLLPATAQTMDGPAGVAIAQAPEVPTLPNSNVVDVEKNAGSTKTRPAFRLLPQFVPGSEDWSRPYADWLDNGYNQWLAAEVAVSVRFELVFGIDYSLFAQLLPKGQPFYATVFYPYVTCKPLKYTQFGSREPRVLTQT